MDLLKKKRREKSAWKSIGCPFFGCDGNSLGKRYFHRASIISFVGVNFVIVAIYLKRIKIRIVFVTFYLLQLHKLKIHK
jgi:hypothetical protein